MKSIKVYEQLVSQFNEIITIMDRPESKSLTPLEQLLTVGVVIPILKYCLTHELKNYEAYVDNTEPYTEECQVEDFYDYILSNIPEYLNNAEVDIDSHISYLLHQEHLSYWSGRHLIKSTPNIVQDVYNLFIKLHWRITKRSFRYHSKIEIKYKYGRK